MMNRTYDAIIIGFGKGGKTLAGKLAQSGKSVALIEKSDKMYGGTCINVGCIPSKSLVRSASISSLMNKTASGEADFEGQTRDYAAAIREKERITGMLRKKNYDKLNVLDRVTIYNGTASFLSNTSVLVQPADASEAEFIIEGENIFINTGSTPVIPPIEGMKGNSRVFFSETLMDFPKLPEKLAIIGGGYIGLEFSSIYSGFGSQVTVFQDGDVFLPREDSDIADEIKAALELKGVSFKTGAKISAIGQTSCGSMAEISYSVNGAEEKFTADAVLIATGRKPNTAGLNAEAAGVELTERGAVKVDEYLKTTAPNIWAMGDVAGGLQFTYISLDDYRIVWNQIEKQLKKQAQLTGQEQPDEQAQLVEQEQPNEQAQLVEQEQPNEQAQLDEQEQPKGQEQRAVNDYSTKKRANVPYSVFIDPPFSRVGLNEREAEVAGHRVKIMKLPAAAVPKAQVLKKPVGMLKAVVDADTNKILGAMLLCEESYEMINIVKLAIDLNADYTVLRDQIFTHPTMSEALNDLFS